MSPFKDFHLAYNVFNEEETFSEGDAVEGTFSFTLKKETTVKTILVSVRGVASVSWDEGTGDDKRSYHDHRQYFKVKEYIVPKISGGSKLPQGPQSFNFHLLIPPGSFPSSFNGVTGQIVYTLEVKISRSWRLPTKIKKELKFLSMSPINCGEIVSPYSLSACKDVGLFSSTGKVQLSGTMNKNIYTPGETADVMVKILNQSPKTLTPKVKLQQCLQYRAGPGCTIGQQTCYKHVGDTINANSEGTFTSQVQIPADIVSTIRNCEIISVEYYLRVYLGIFFGIEPQLQLPLIIIPSRFANLYSAGAVCAPTHSDFPPPVPSSSYGYPAPYLTQFTPSGLPPEHQASTPEAVGAQEENPPSQEEQPPSYQFLSPPDNNYNCTESNKK